MKYHYQEGISDKKKEGSKSKLVFLSIVGLLAVGYGVFLSLTPALNGWPLVPIDETANALQSSNPGENGNRLYIPRLNVSSPTNELQIDGNPKNEDVVVEGQRFKIGLTPQQTRQTSPFYNLDKLNPGDEIFLDYNNTRYAYRVSKDTNNEDSVLTLRAPGGPTVKAQSVGTVARENGKLEVQDQAF